MKLASYWVPTASGTGCSCWHTFLHGRRRLRPRRVLRSAGRRWGGSKGRSQCRTQGGRTRRAARDTPNQPPATKTEGRRGIKLSDTDGSSTPCASVGPCSHGSRCRQTSTGRQEPADRWRRCSRGPHTPDQSEHSSTSELTGNAEGVNTIGRASTSSRPQSHSSPFSTYMFPQRGPPSRLSGCGTLNRHMPPPCSRLTDRSAALQLLNCWPGMKLRSQVTRG